MERYIEQLIEDLNEAARKVPSPGELWNPVDMDDAGEVEDMAYAERFIHGTPQPLSEIIGIEKILLPPTERLNEQQTLKLVNVLTSVLNAYHFYPDFPEDLPAQVKYPILLKEWDEPHVFVGAGESHIEFCKDYMGDCPFPQEFCGCRKFEEETEREEQEVKNRQDKEDGEVPF